MLAWLKNKRGVESGLLALAMLLIAIDIALLFAVSPSWPSKFATGITGMFAVDDGFERYSQELNLKISGDESYDWELANYSSGASLKYARFSGSWETVEGQENSASFKAYLVDSSGNKYLIADSDSIKPSTLAGITALFVSEEKAAEKEQAKEEKAAAKEEKKEEKAADSAPTAESTPAEQPQAETPAQETPPTEETPPIEEQPPAETLPVETPPIETPTEQPPVEEPPVVEQPPVEEPPAEIPPVEQPPVEEPPVVEELPVIEEPPIEEPLVVEQPPIEIPPAETPAAEEILPEENITEEINATELNITNTIIIEFDSKCAETCLLVDGLIDSSYTLLFEASSGTLSIDSVTYALKPAELMNETINFTKVKEDPSYDLIIDSANLTEDGSLVVIFHHDYDVALPIAVDGEINYTLSTETLNPGETATLIIPNYNDEYFRIKIGTTSEAFAFGNAKQQNIEVNIQDSQNQDNNASVKLVDKFLEKEEKSFEANKAAKVKKGEYDLVVTLNASPVNTIEFENITVDSDSVINIGVDNVPEFGSYVKVYAIDPTQFNFTNATVTVTATGSELYKCKSWDFAAQTCTDGNWVKVMDITPGADYSFSLTPEDPAYAELKAQTCAAENNAAQGSFGSACTGTYPSACGATGDLLSCNDALTENKTSNSNTVYGGVRITAYNSSVNNCLNITSVFVCYEWWSSSTSIAACNISVDNDNGTSYSSVTTTCPGTTANPGVTCANATSLDDWQCSNFFGASGNRSLLKSEFRSSSGSTTRTVRWDVLFFNVTYNNAMPDITPPAANLISPANGNITANNAINFNCNATDNYNLANITFYWNYSGSWQANETANVGGVFNETTFARTNLNNSAILWSCLACDNASQCAFAPANWTVVVNATLPDSTPPATVTNLANQSQTTTSIYWSWTNPADTDFNHTEVWLDGVWKANVLKPTNYYNATGLNANTSYTIQTRTADNTGNINTTWVNNTASTLPLPDTTPPATITNLANQSQTTTSIYWSWTNPTDADFNHTEIWLDEVWQANVSAPTNYYNATGLNANTSYTIQTRTVDNVGNINTSWINDSATTASPILNLSNIDIIYPINGTSLPRGSDVVSYEDGIAAVNNDIGIIAKVYDNSTLNGLQNVNCSFYFDSTLIGTAPTNSSGHCNLVYDKSNKNFGWHSITVNYTNLPSGYAANIPEAANQLKIENWTMIIEIVNYRSDVGAFYYEDDIAGANITIRRGGVLVNITNMSMILSNNLNQNLEEFHLDAIAQLGTGNYYVETVVPNQNWLRWKGIASYNFDNVGLINATSSLHTDVSIDPPPNSLNLTVVNGSDEVLENTTIKLYRYGLLSKHLVYSTSLDATQGSARRSAVLNDNNYEIEIDMPGNQSLAIMRLNVTANDLKIKSQSADYAGALPSGIAKLSKVMASDASVFEKATLYFDKQFEPTQICKCENWNFSSADCAGTWQCDSTSEYEYASNDTTFWFNVTDFTGYAGGAGSNANLTIWDATDPEGGNQTKYINNQVNFFANYTNSTSGQSINGTNVWCEIRFNITGNWTSPVNTSFNSSSLLYEYNRSFSSAGTLNWNALCNGSAQGYDVLNATDNVTVTFNSSITGCANMPSPGTYYLQNNVNSSGTCFNIQANDVTLDCAGYSITGNNSSDTYGVYSNQINTTIRNCNISNFATGIYFNTADNGTIDNTTARTTQAASGNNGYGIYLYNGANYNRIMNSNANASVGYGIYLSINSNYNTISNTTATTTATNSYAIRFSSNSNYNNIVNTTATAYNSAIFFQSSSNYNTISNSAVTATNYAIYLQSNYNTISNSAVTATNYAIYLDSGSNNTLIANTITTSGTSSNGIKFLYNSQNNTLLNNFIKSATTYIGTASNSINNNMTNTTFNQTNSGVRFPTTITIPGNKTIDQSNLNLTFNKVYLNTGELTFLNTGAEITLRNLTFTEPKATVDFDDDGSFTDCPTNVCTNLGYSGGTFVYNVTGFTAYSSAEGDTTPPGTVTDLNESAVGGNWIYWNWTNPADSDFSRTIVYIDGVWKANVSKPTNHYNATGLNSSTTYTIQTKTADTAGNINTSWVNDSATTLCQESWQANYGSCLTNDTQLKWYADANSCGTANELPADNGTYVSCNYCSENITGPYYTSCAPTDNQTRYYTDQNYNSCCAITGLTSDCSIVNNASYANTTVSCDYCTTSWYEINTTCRTDDTKTGWHNDSNNCYAMTGLPSDNNPPANNTYSCDYCSPAPTNTTWTDWQNQGSCLTNDTQQQNRSRIEYDANYASCYAITGLPSDLWNSGNNNTYWDYQAISCDYCVPNFHQVIDSCQTNDLRTVWYNDSNSCYQQTGLLSDKPAANFTQSCDYCTPNIQTINGSCQPTDNYTRIYNDSNNCYSQTGLPSDAVPANDTAECDYIISTEFGGSTTNFATANLSNMPNLVLENTNFGKINFSELISIIQSTDLDSNIEIANNSISINTIALPGFNKSAALELYHLSFVNPVILKDGAECPSQICAKISYSAGNLVFSVTGFSSYSASEGIYCGDGSCNGGETCSSCIADCGSCPTGGSNRGGGGGGGSGGIIIPTNESCKEKWSCGEWSDCLDGKQTRACSDLDSCGTTVFKPNEIKSCGVSCEEKWACTEWGPCVDNTQIRVCKDVNNCETGINKPAETQDCEMLAAALPSGAKLTGKAVISPLNLPNPQFLIPTMLLLIVLISLVVLRRSVLSKKLRTLIAIMHIVLIMIIVTLLLLTFKLQIKTAFASALGKAGVFAAVLVFLAIVVTAGIWYFRKIYKRR